MSAPCIPSKTILQSDVESLIHSKRQGMLWQVTGPIRELNKPCDLVLLVVLPGGHGLDVLAEIQSKTTSGHCSRRRRGTGSRQGLRLGADDYVVNHSVLMNFSRGWLFSAGPGVLHNTPHHFPLGKSAGTVGKSHRQQARHCYPNGKCTSRLPQQKRAGRSTQ